MACLMQIRAVAPPLPLKGPDWSLRTPNLILGGCARARLRGRRVAATAGPSRPRREIVMTSSLLHLLRDVECPCPLSVFHRRQWDLTFNNARSQRLARLSATGVDLDLSAAEERSGHPTEQLKYAFRSAGHGLEGRESVRVVSFFASTVPATIARIPRWSCRRSRHAAARRPVRGFTGFITHSKGR